MEYLGPLLPALDRIGVVTVLILIALATITDKLVWHTRLKAANQRADRWEKVAIDALTGAAQASVKAAETTLTVVSALPDPTKDRQET